MSEHERDPGSYWEAVLRNVVANAPIVLFAIDVDGIFTFSDGMGLEALGLKPGQVVGLSVYDVYRDVPEIGDCVRFALQGHAHVQTVRVGHLTFVARYAPARDDDGHVYGVVGVSLDITDRVAAEEQLRESEQRFKSIVDSSPMGMHLYELQDNDRLVFVGANPAADAILRVDHRQFIGKTIEEAFPALVSTEVPERYREVARTGVVWQTSQVHYEDDVIRGAFDLVAFRTSERHMVTTFLDVSDRVRAEHERLEFERRLLHAQRLESLGVLAGGLAHDFNNLLMAVLGNLDLAQLSLSPVSPAQAGIDQAIQATRKATDLTRQMLAYSGKGRFVITRLDLRDVVRENASLFRAAISRRVTLAIDLEDEGTFVEGDPSQIQQVVMNLITNASDAIGDEPGVVTIRTGTEVCDEAGLIRSRVEDRPAAGRFCYVEVADTGAGMDEETKRRLFDPFFTTKFTGRGLGMSAVLGIVRGHKGAIFVDTRPGAGTTIRVLFPSAGQQPAVADRPAEPAPAPAEPARVVNRAVVLVVDDDEPVRRLCLTYVERLGFEGIGAEDGEVALDVFRQRPDVACVLLDLTMPKMDGVTTFRELRRIRPDVRVILSSGFNEQDAVQRFVGEGLAGFVQKPFRLADLRARLTAVLGTTPG